MSTAWLVLVAALALAQAARAQDVQRCEGPGGKVVYANGPCPPNTTPVRTLPPTDAPTSADQKAARQRGQQDVRSAAELDRARKAEDERMAREDAQVQAQRKKQETQCRRLQSRLDAAQKELADTASSRRVEAQRRVRRAEQLYLEDCAPAKN
jgi:hypothetical protein